MATVIWSNLALEDLRSVYDYVSQDSPNYADRLLDKLVARTDALRDHTRLGKKVPEFNRDTIRELIEGHYRIIYRIENEERVGIARVHHSARLLKGL